MDPVSAVGIASAAAQFISFAAGILSTAAEIRQSASGRTVHEAHLDALSRNLIELIANLDGKLYDIRSSRNLSPNEEMVKRLGDSCDTIAADLQAAINQIKKPVLGRGHGLKKWTSFQQALRSLWNKNKIESLRQQLESLSQQLIISLLLALKYVYL